MPSGSVHLKIEAGLLFGWTGLAGYLLSHRAITVEMIVAFVLAYAFSMLFLSPDLDLARSRAARRWGNARWLWTPYALIFRHRGLSHHPLVGPVTRIVYVSVAAGALFAVVAVLIGRSVRIAIPPASLLLSVLAGLYVPNLTHIVADRAGSAWRRRRGRKRL